MTVMRRPILIFILGLVAAGLGFGLVYRLKTASQRELVASQHSELLWLQAEFGLTQPEFARIKELHEGYLPKCKQHCREIEALNKKLRLSLSGTREMTAQTESLLAERGRMVAECQREMLAHFYAVSQAMPPAQGKRYLVWVHEHTCLRVPSEGNHMAGLNQQP